MFIIPNPAALLVALVIVFYSSPAFAYMDPGIVASLFQSLYVIVFGVAAAWIIKPWIYIKSLFIKKSDIEDE